MEKAPKMAQTTSTYAMEVDENEGGATMQPPALDLTSTPPPPTQIPDAGLQYVEYEEEHRTQSFSALLADLQGQHIGFLGGLRNYLLTGEGRPTAVGKMLAAVEAVIGHPFSPAARTWLRNATEADRTAMRALTGSNFDWNLPEVAGQGTEDATVANSDEETLNPAFVARKQIFHELWLFEMSQLVMDWAEARISTDAATALFSAGDLQGDSAQMGVLRSTTDTMITEEFTLAGGGTDWQMTAIRAKYATYELDWILRFMVYQGVLVPPVDTASQYTYHSGGGSAGASFASQHTAVTTLNDTADTRLNTRDPQNGMFESGVIDPERSSNIKAGEVEQQNVDRVAALEAQIAAETDPAKKAELEAQLEEAQQVLEDSRGPRSFAESILPLFNRMTANDPPFRLGNYDSHNWGQFSVDLYLNAGFDRGFWMYSTTVRFFDQLAAAAEMDESASGGAGKFAWFALYNDTLVAADINEKYGDGRIRTDVAGHGPGDSLHIHLDIRPMNMAPDSQTGYSINSNGRVEVP